MGLVVLGAPFIEMFAQMGAEEAAEALGQPPPQQEDVSMDGASAAPDSPMQCSPCEAGDGSSLQRSDRSRSDRRRSTPSEGATRARRRLGAHVPRSSCALFGFSAGEDAHSEYVDRLAEDFGDPYASDVFSDASVLSQCSDGELDGLYFSD